MCPNLRRIVEPRYFPKPCEPPAGGTDTLVSVVIFFTLALGTRNGGFSVGCELIYPRDLDLTELTAQERILCKRSIIFQILTGGGPQEGDIPASLVKILLNTLL